MMWHCRIKECTCNTCGICTQGSIEIDWVPTGEFRDGERVMVPACVSFESAERNEAV